VSAPRQDADEWVTAVARPNTPLFLSILVTGQNRSAIEASTGLPLGFENIRRAGIRLQYKRAELVKAKAVVHEQSAAEGVAFFERYADRCLDSCEELLSNVDRLAQEHRSRGDRREGLEPALASYFAAAAKLATFLQTLIVVQFELEDVLREFVTDRLGTPPGEEARAVMRALQVSLEPTDELCNLAEMLKLAILAQASVDHREWRGADPIAAVACLAYRHDAVWAGLESYRARFGWMGRRYYSGDPITPIDLGLRLQNLLRKDCRVRLAEIERRRDAHLEERERAIDRLGADARPLADVLSRYMYLRSHRLDTFFIAHEQVVPLFGDVARLLALNGYEDTVQLSWQELMDGVQGRCEGRQLASRAARRRTGFEFVAHGESTEWIDADGPAESPAAAEAPPQTLQGVCGWEGRSRGRVRVIADDDDMLLMQPGEILVATMTQPRLMLAVEKAGAIVTDEGGMLCHAVLVSREFDLPCVIGTEHATHVLRSGDLVDIDAGEGVVRLVSRPEHPQKENRP
jgi:phosphohistidine swiveling domain-containing protein